MEDDLAYISVPTVFQTLENNDHVRHEDEGKAYRYVPSVRPEKAGREAVGYILNRIYQGSGRAMVEALLETAALTEKETHAEVNALGERDPVAA